MSDPLQDLFEQASDHPWLEFLGRRWPAKAVLAQAECAAGGLRALGLAPGERLGLMLPNLPVAVTALLAAWQAGLAAAPMDPRQPRAALAAWQERVRPAALVTLDLATVYERARPLFDHSALRFVLVARMAPQLSTLKRLVSPWLRAGGTARPAFDQRTRAWESLTGTAAPPVPAAPTALVLPDGTTLSREDLAALARPPWAGRSLLARPLADATAVAALLASLAGGGTLVLSPRLDERSLLKVAAAAKTESVV
jgi:long-chain acyl-CoA synthetase